MGRGTIGEGVRDESGKITFVDALELVGVDSLLELRDVSVDKSGVTR